MINARKKIDHLISKGWIKPSISQYNHPILFAKKKNGRKDLVGFGSLMWF